MNEEDAINKLANSLDNAETADQAQEQEHTDAIDKLASVFSESLNDFSDSTDAATESQDDSTPTATETTTASADATDENTAETGTVKASEDETEDGQSAVAGQATEQPDSLTATNNTDEDRSNEPTLTALRGNSGRRYVSANDRIRNAVNAAKFIEEEAAKRIQANFQNTVSKDQIIEYIKQQNPKRDVEELTLDELVPLVNPHTGALEGGRIDPLTNEPFTEEGAKYFLAQRAKQVKELNAEYESKLNEEYGKFTSEVANTTREAAIRASDDHKVISSLLAVNPVLDLENPDLPEPIAKIASHFWKEVAEKYSEQVFGESLLKSDFDINKAAEGFLEANKDLIKDALSKSYQGSFEKGKQAAKEAVEKVAKATAQGAIAPVGSSTAVSTKEPADKGDLLAADVLDYYRKNKVKR